MSRIDYEALSTSRLEGAGFFSAGLSDLELVTPTTRMNGATLVRFSAYGNPSEAETIVFEPLPGTVKLDDLTIQLRLKAQQTALGEDYALVGVELYNPRDIRLNRDERRTTSQGFFGPFALRLLKTIETVGPRDDQKVGLYGYSLGADVSVEAAYENLTNETFGQTKIEHLGVYEACRMQNRGRVALQRAAKVGQAFKDSGPDLFNNIVNTASPALLEASGIDINDPDAERKHAKSVEKVVKKYITKDILGNIAISSGLGHDITIDQLKFLCQHKDMPWTTLGRMRNSTMSPPGVAFLHLPFVERLRTRLHDGDHSKADNLRYSAAFVLETVDFGK